MLRKIQFRFGPITPKTIRDLTILSKNEKISKKLQLLWKTSLLRQLTHPHSILNISNKNLKTLENTKKI